MLSHKNNFDNIKDHHNIVNSDSIEIKKYFTIPYLNNISEKFQSISQKFDFNIAYKPMNCLNKFIKTGKDKIKKYNHSNMVYKINCLDCNESYVGQTKRKLNTEHKNDIKKCSSSLSVISQHRQNYNHKMDREVDGIVEMFIRSENIHDVKYKYHIGDRDSKSYKNIVDADPYEETKVVKKECVNHVSKRMGSRLRKCKKNNKGLGGKGKLTDKVINDMSLYYNLAIRRNKDSVNDMHI
ncbi:hypothetical protein ALC57_09615 [Trachymyrmex cornetzi]|uniref:Mutator-like transposase domain-containing protein n=1 Tax=Trachymyrmex cornetzi TaxID=471704 RepID=A0A195DYY5_9HYME|nr:hypothetical protein ALC57_09615 [Trachymyrmex cornetzi]